MTNSYFKYQGGRGSFKRQNIGDGSQEIRRQSETITSGLKARQLREEQYGSQRISYLIRKGQNQSENSRILKELDNKEFKTKYDAIDVRKQNEIDFHKSRAVELGKESEYWMDFTETGALNLAKGAKAGYDFAEELIGEARFKKYQESEEYKNNIHIFGQVGAQEDRYIVEDGVDAVLKGDWKLSKWLARQRKKNGHTFSKLLAEDVISKIDGLENDHLKFLVDQGPKVYNYRNASRLWDDYALKLVDYLGIRKDTTGGKLILEHFKQKGTTQSILLKNASDSEQDTYDRNELIGNILNNTNDQELGTLLEALVTHNQTSVDEVEPGKFIGPKDKKNRHLYGWRTTLEQLTEEGYFSGPAGKANLQKVLEHVVFDKTVYSPKDEAKLDLLKEELVKLQESVTDPLKSKAQISKIKANIVGHNLKIKLLEKKGKKIQITLREKFKSQNLENDLLQAISKKDTKLLELEAEKKDSTILGITQSIDEDLKNKVFDLSTIKGQNDFWDKYGRNSLYPEVKAKVNFILSYNPKDHGAFEVHQKLKKAHRQGDLPEFLNWYHKLKPAQQQRYQTMFKDLTVLSEGVTEQSIAKDLESWSDQVMKDKLSGLQGGAPAGYRSQSAILAQQGLIKAFNYHFAALGNEDLTPAARVAKAKTLATTEFLQADGVGKIFIGGETYKNNAGKAVLYDSNGGVVFASYYQKPSNDSQITKENITEAFSGVSYKDNIDGFMKSKEALKQSKIKAQNDLVDKYILDENFISANQIGTVMTEITGGADLITYPENVSILSDITGQSKRSIMNRILVARGYTTDTSFIRANGQDLLRKAMELNGSSRHFPIGISQRHSINLLPLLIGAADKDSALLSGATIIKQGAQ